MSTENMATSVERLLEKAGPESVFGEPRTFGDKTVIPIAKLSYGFGFGFGRGKSTESRQALPGEGEVGGAGGGLNVKPLALLEVSEKGARLRPVTDDTLIILAGILLGAWSIFWISKTIRAFLAHRR